MCRVSVSVSVSLTHRFKEWQTKHRKLYNLVQKKKDFMMKLNLLISKPKENPAGAKTAVELCERVFMCVCLFPLHECRMRGAVSGSG